MSLQQSKYGLNPTGTIVFPALKRIEKGDMIGVFGMPYRYINPIQEFVKVF